MKIALIHDWLTGMRGGEKVLEVLCGIFPEADVFTLVHLPGKVSPVIERHRIITSPLQRIPGIGRYYRHLLPFMPWAIEKFNFKGYDALISTSHCVAKGAEPPPGVNHWCYCHTPMRYIWDQYDSYFGPGRTSWPVQKAMELVRPRMQRWDVESSARVYQFFANSKNVQDRIEQIYHRSSSVIYPPVETEFFGMEPGPSPLNDPYYLIVSAFAPYKRLDIAVEAFTLNKKSLIIIGEGQEEAQLRAKAGPNIQFKGWLDAAGLRQHYALCRALIFPGEEDFGIVPVEAMAAGRPVIAFSKGGALETVINGRTGIFFDKQTPKALMETVRRFEIMTWDSAEIKRHARNFDRQQCEKAFREAFVEFL